MIYCEWCGCPPWISRSKSTLCCDCSHLIVFREKQDVPLTKEEWELYDKIDEVMQIAGKRKFEKVVQTR